MQECSFLVQTQGRRLPRGCRIKELAYVQRGVSRRDEIVWLLIQTNNSYGLRCTVDIVVFVRSSDGGIHAIA